MRAASEGVTRLAIPRDGVIDAKVQVESGRSGWRRSSIHVRNSTGTIVCVCKPVSNEENYELIFVLKTFLKSSSSSTVAFRMSGVLFHGSKREEGNNEPSGGGSSAR